MNKEYTFTFDKNTSNNSFFGAFGTKTTNYSKILDDLIASDIMKKNNYLKNYYSTPANDTISCALGEIFKKPAGIIIDSIALKDNNKFIKAANFLANYKKKNILFPNIIFGKTYKLNDGTPIIFYDDEIMIGLDLYSYDDFKDITFLNLLPKKTKSAIINITTIINITL